MGGLLDIPIKTFVIISTIIAIFISCLSVMNLRKLMLKNKEAKSLFSEFLVVAIAFCAIFNFMYIENLYFAEAAIMALAVYLSIIAAEKLLISDTKNIVKSLIYLLFAIFCYNGVISVYVATVLLLLVIGNEKKFKKNIKIILNACAFCIVAIILNFIQIKIVCNYLNLTQNRINGLETMANNFAYILLNWWKVLIDTAGLFPKYLFIIFLGLFFVIYYFTKNEEKSLDWKILFLGLLSIASSFAIYLCTLSSFGSGRLHTNIGMLIGYLFIIIYIKTNILEEKKVTSYCMKILIILYLIINIINILDITKNHQEVNEIEKLKAYEIAEYIENYELENNIEVKYIVMKYVSGQNEKAFYKRQTTANCIGIYDEPSFDGLINLYSGRNLQRVALTEYMNKKFIEQTEGKQVTVQCIGNVLVCVVYIV